MYNIAICDDDKIFIQYLKRMILSASEDKNYQLNIYEYYSGEELIMNLEGTVHFDLLILDMQLGRLDGDETARIFRKYFPESVLAFCSGVRQPTIESFKATPFRYIDKSCSEEEFIYILREILNEVERISDEPYIMAHYKRTERKIKTKDILYIQSAKRGSEIILCSQKRDSVIEERMLMKRKPEELLSEMEKYGFAMIQSACIVNMDHIVKIGVKDIVLDDGQILSIARSYQKSFKEAFARRFANKY